MRKLFSMFRKSPKQVAAVIAMVAAVIIIPATLLAWGPARDTYTMASPADHVTFNSITDNPVQGDERNFMQVREATAGNETYADSISLTANKEYVVNMYYHNNAASNLNASGVGIAHGAYIKAAIPADVPQGSNGTKAVGYIGASNATPSEVWDDISFKNTTSSDMYLSFIPGSATIHNFGKTNGLTMPDSIVTNGTSLGYDLLNGDLPGCNEYSGYVTFRVKATQSTFTVQKQVRIQGTTEWSENVTAKAGDTLEYRIEYMNTGSTTQTNVVVKDSLPAHQSYVAGSTTLKNVNNPNGKALNDDLTTKGVNIGDYTAGSNAFVKFNAKISGTESLECGTNQLVNTASVTVGNDTKADTASATVSKECAPKECKPGIPVGDARCYTLPKTGPSDTIAMILGAGTLSAGTAYFVASRRKLGAK